jgi:hypothetical protein
MKKTWPVVSGAVCSPTTRGQLLGGGDGDLGVHGDSVALGAQAVDGSSVAMGCGGQRRAMERK